MPIVFIPTMLLPLSGGVKQVKIDAANLRQVIDGLDRLYPGIKSRLVEDGDIRRNLAVAVDGEVARTRYTKPCPRRPRSTSCRPSAAVFDWPIQAPLQWSGWEPNM